MISHWKSILFLVLLTHSNLNAIVRIVGQDGEVINPEYKFTDLTAEEKKIIPSLCQRPEPSIERSIKIPDIAEFFFRPFPNGERISYSARKKNYILDLKTGKKEVVPGEYDAFPTPDGRLLVIANGAKGITFYESNNVKEPLFNDPQMDGYYQSVGVLNNSSGNKVYRVIIYGKDGYKIKDYIQNPKSNNVIESKAPPKVVCSNVGELSLPMISKDGSRLAAFDVTTQATNIYNIDEKTGNCSVAYTLGVSTGKVDFSFDGKSVAYSQVAVADFENANGDLSTWMRHPNEEMVANIFVHNLETGDTRALTHYTHSNALYPSFNSKGEVIARKYDELGTEFIVLNPNKIESQSKTLNTSQISQCLEQSSDMKRFLGLGAMFLRYCDKQAKKWSADSIILLGQDLNKNQCKLLANLWKKNISQKNLDFLKMPLKKAKANISILKSIFEIDIKAACEMK